MQTHVFLEKGSLYKAPVFIINVNGTLSTSLILWCTLSKNDITYSYGNFRSYCAN